MAKPNSLKAVIEALEACIAAAPPSSSSFILPPSSFSAIPFSINHSPALAPSQQIKNTSCTVPVPLYKHFKPPGVGYCTRNRGGAGSFGGGPL